MFHCHNAYTRHPSSWTIFYIIKRIYDNNNYNCYQWIKSKYSMVTFVCRRYHITYRFSTSHTPNNAMLYRVFEYAHSCPLSPRLLRPPTHRILRPLADRHDEFSNMTNLYGFPFRNGKSAAYGFLPYARPEIIAPVHTRRGLCQLKALSVHFTSGRPPLTSDPFTLSYNSTIVCLWLKPNGPEKNTRIIIIIKK